MSWVCCNPETSLGTKGLPRALRWICTSLSLAAIVDRAAVRNGVDHYETASGQARRASVAARRTSREHKMKLESIAKGALVSGIEENVNYDELEIEWPFLLDV